MLTYILIGLLSAIVAYLITTLSFLRKFADLTVKANALECSRDQWKKAAQDVCYTTVRYNYEFDAFQVVRYAPPYATIIASFSCKNDEDFAYALACEFSDTINYFISYQKDLLNEKAYENT